MRGPPITITCDCGEAGSLRYGERWQCPRCGRRWSTEQIPAAEYEGLVRDLRRFKLQMVVAVLVVLAVFVPLIVFVNQGFVFVVPLLLGGAAIFYGPIWKRRVRRRVADAPRWELHPDPE